MRESKPFEPIEILNAARKAVPAVNYALGVAGLAAAAALTVGFIGNGRAGIISLSCIIIAMIVLFLFARLVADKRSKSIVWASNVVMWSIVIFICGFLAMTAAAFTLGWPTVWAAWLGIKVFPDAPTASRDFVIGKWLAFRNREDLQMGTVIEYRNNGTCISSVWTIGGGKGAHSEPLDCRWQFEKISDSEFKLSVSYPGSLTPGGTSEYRIIDQDHVRRLKGLGRGDTAERLK